MLSIRKLVLAGAFTSAALLGAMPANAVVTTFATYSAVTTAPNIYWKKVGVSGGSIYTTSTGTATTAGSTTVNFSFLQPALAALGELKSTFTLSGTTSLGNPAVLLSGFLIQPVVSGSFSFIYAGAAPLTVGSTVYHTGDNLLSAVFTNAAIVGGSGASSGSLSASTSTDAPPIPAITYTSAFLDFDETLNQDFSFSLTSITSALFRANALSSLRTFRASSSGAFSTDPAPVVTAVPEPAVWGAMLMGFALVGVQVRKRRRAVVTA